jgi:hypothetical protein
LHLAENAVCIREVHRSLERCGSSLWNVLYFCYQRLEFGERRGVYRVLVGKPEGKRPLGRPRRRWEDNIKMDLHEVDWRVWTGSSWLRIGTGGGHLKAVM